jgi:hypothetical protein
MGGPYGNGRGRARDFPSLLLGDDRDGRHRLSGLGDTEPTAPVETKRPLGVRDLALPVASRFSQRRCALDSLVTAARNNYAAPSSQPDKSRSQPWDGRRGGAIQRDAISALPRVAGRTATGLPWHWQRGLRVRGGCCR